MTEPQKGPGRDSPPPPPRWVIVLGIIFVLLILLVIILHLLGFGFVSHGMSGMEMLLPVADRHFRP
jgi:hypothetical protein